MSTAEEEPSGFAGWALGWPLSFGLGVVAVVQIGTWLPHYLTWPYWADHDVFATAARAWDLGILPYREVRQNNFPGTIYLFYALGKLGGWGRPWACYAVDSALLLTLLIVLVVWSRRTFDRALPGLIGAIAWLSEDLSLDYCHAAQRDGQGPSLMVLALLIAQGWPGRASRFVSALLVAVAFAIRPQTILFLPAVLLAIMSGEGPKFRRGLTWLATLAGLVALAFLPLIVNGIFGDFLRSLRQVAFGSTYNRVTPVSVAKGWLLQASALRWLVVPSGILLLAFRGEGRGWTISRAWLVALAGASLYKPLSPMPHSYLEIPLDLAWSMNLAVLAGLIVSTPEASSTLKLVGVLSLLGLGTTTLRSEFCVVGPNLRAIETLRSGVEPEAAPPGYRHGSVGTSAFYPWADYRATLLYLRAHTTSKTRVANALKGDPAIVSAVDRLSAFPAESVAWLRMVNPGDEPAFVESLERANDSVVIWSPGEVGVDPNFRIDQIEAAIRRLYHFEARFGTIEVWRREENQRP